MSKGYVFRSVSTLPDRKKIAPSTFRLTFRAIKRALDLRHTIFRQWIVKRFFPPVRYPDKPSNMLIEAYKLQELGMQHEAAMLKVVAYLMSRVEDLEKMNKHDPQSR